MTQTSAVGQSILHSAQHAWVSCVATFCHTHHIHHSRLHVTHLGTRSYCLEEQRPAPHAPTHSTAPQCHAHRHPKPACSRPHRRQHHCRCHGCRHPWLAPQVSPVTRARQHPRHQRRGHWSMSRGVGLQQACPRGLPQASAVQPPRQPLSRRRHCYRRVVAVSWPRRRAPTGMVAVQAAGWWWWCRHPRMVPRAAHHVPAVAAAVVAAAVAVVATPVAWQHLLQLRRRPFLPPKQQACRPARHRCVAVVVVVRRQRQWLLLWRRHHCHHVHLQHLHHCHRAVLHRLSRLRLH